MTIFIYSMTILGKHPPAWPGHEWQAPEPQPVNTGLSGGGESSSTSREMTAKLENTLLAATIGVTIFFALVLLVRSWHARQPPGRHAGPPCRQGRGRQGQEPAARGVAQQESRQIDTRRDIP